MVFVRGHLAPCTRAGIRSPARPRNCLPASASAEGAPVIVDTSALPAFFDASEPDHDAVSAALAAADVLVVSPYAVAELDYLVATRHGVDDELAVLAGGAWDLAAFDEESFAAPGW